MSYRVNAKQDCDHANCRPQFNEGEAWRLLEHGTETIRRRFPRFQGPCPDCGMVIVAYASYLHYVLGDW